MSKHRQRTATAPPQVYGSATHLDQVVAVVSEHDRVEISMTPEAAVELARIMVQYGSAVRQGHISPTGKYDPALWHDVGLTANTGVLRATTGRPRTSRYVGPQDPTATGRRRNGRAPLVIVGADQ